MKSRRSAHSKKAALRAKSGGSNVGEYVGLRPAEFAGPSGGAPAGSFPVNTEARAKAALAYARHAPNPAGIRRKAYAAAERHGWFGRPRKATA